MNDDPPDLLAKYEASERRRLARLSNMEDPGVNYCSNCGFLSSSPDADPFRDLAATNEELRAKYREVVGAVSDKLFEFDMWVQGAIAGGQDLDNEELLEFSDELRNLFDEHKAGE